MEMSPILDRKKRRFTENQKKILMQRFQANKYPTREERRELAMSLNMREKQIANWYIHMRHQKATEGMSSQGEYCSVKYIQEQIINYFYAVHNCT